MTATGTDRPATHPLDARLRGGNDLELFRVGNSWDHEAFRDYVIVAAANLPNVKTQADIARVAGIVPSLLSKWFRGLEQPNFTSLEKLATGLQVPLRDLIALSGRLPEGEVGERPVPPPPILVNPLALELDRMLDDESPLSDEDRHAIRTIVDRVIAPYRRQMRRRRPA
jgi:transcriptional regulator with XRE-family HTH domain